MKRIEVEWLDSESSMGWQTYNDADKFARDSIVVCKSTGYLFWEDAKVLVLVQSYNPENVSEIIKIPKFAIKKRKFLK